MAMEISMEWIKNNEKIFGGHQSIWKNMKQAIGLLSLLKLIVKNHSIVFVIDFSVLLKTRY